jgi:hypothetical protein
MTQPLVFVSSRISTTQEDLSRERACAIETITGYRPFQVWAFEDAPASPFAARAYYLENVKASALVVAIVGADVSVGVREELETACTHRKPVLLFVKRVAGATQAVADLKQTATVTYRHFTTTDELKRELERALGEYVAEACTKRDAHSGNPLPEGLVRLRPGDEVQVTPCVPSIGPYTDFTVFRVERREEGLLTLVKRQYSVGIPIGAIVRVDSLGSDRRSILHLRGRLQHNAVEQAWEYRSETPVGPEDWMGLPTPVSMENLQGICSFLQQRGCEAQIVARLAVPDWRDQAYVVFTEPDDGRCPLARDHQKNEYVVVFVRRGAGYHLLRATR